MNERDKKGPTQGLIQQGGQCSRSPNVVRASRKLRRYLFKPRKPETYTRTCEKSKGTCLFRHVKIPPPTRQLQTKLSESRSDCEHEDQYFFVDTGASLHVVRKNVLTSGKKDDHQKINRNHRHLRPPTSKAESTEGAAVYLIDAVGRIHQQCCLWVHHAKK